MQEIKDIKAIRHIENSTMKKVPPVSNYFKYKLNAPIKRQGLAA